MLRWAGLHVPDDFGQARHYGLQGLIGGVGGGVLAQSGEQGFGGREAVVLLGGEHVLGVGVGVRKGETWILASESWIRSLARDCGRVTQRFVQVT